MSNKKRRKAKDNPYTINFNQEKEVYSISFENNKEKFSMEISNKLYNVFNKFELEDISYMNKYDRHIEHLLFDEIRLYKRMNSKEKDLENIVIENIEKEKLYEAINKLSETQKNRIYLYYFENMAQKEIAIQDNCSIRAVQYSLNLAIKNLKKFLK